MISIRKTKTCAQLPLTNNPIIQNGETILNLNRNLFTNIRIGISDMQTEIRPKDLKSVSVNKYHLIIADILEHCG